MLYKPNQRGSTAKDGKVDNGDDDEGSDVEVQPTNGGGRRTLAISHREKLPSLADSMSEQVFKNKIKLRKRYSKKREKKESSGGDGGEFLKKRKKTVHKFNIQSSFL